MGEFVAQERIRVELGPQRLALAVNDGDLEQLTLAMRAASSMWGGRRFPVLSVDETADLTPGSRKLLDVLETTSVIDFTGRLTQSGSVSSGKRKVSVSAARSLDDVRQWTPSAIVSHTVEALEGMRLVEAASEDPFEVAAVGRLACREERGEWADFGAEVTDLRDAEFVSTQLTGAGVIDATLHGIRTTMMSAPFGTSIVLVYVVDDDVSFKDLLWFWNARAMRPGEDGADLLVRRHHLTQNATALADHVRSTARSVPSLALVSVSVPTGDLRGLLAHLGIAERSDSKWTEHMLGGRISEPVTGEILGLVMRQMGDHASARATRTLPANRRGRLRARPPPDTEDCGRSGLASAS